MTDHELDTDDLAALVDPAEVQALEEILGDLKEESEILLFVAPGCPVCPHQIRAAATLTLASPKVSVEVVDVTLERELALQYEVRSVPTTVVDDELILVGAIPAPALARKLLERQSADGESAVFLSLVEAGRVREAGARLAEGPAPGAAVEAFAELWGRSTMQTRIGLTLTAEEALNRAPMSLDGLVPLLLPLLNADGDQGEDRSRLGDTIDLLGRIGHPDALFALEALSESPDPDLAEAAADALEAMAHLDTDEPEE